MINFEQAACQSESQAEEFGLHDPQDGGIAFIDENGEVLWNCTVLNPSKFECLFTAIDNCIELKDGDGNDISACDGMLQYGENVLLIELKHEGHKGGIPPAIAQLRRSIELFMGGRELTDFRQKRAILANSRKPRFRISHKSTMEQFRNETGFRLMIVGEVVLK